MLKGIDTRTGEFVISIDPQWKTDVDPLRESCRREAILCPECKQPVTLRAGDERIWHFAHRADSGCPLKSESAAVLYAKEMLYKLLQERFGNRVSLEEIIPGATDAERADCVVSLDTGKIAYCIVEKQLRNHDDFMAMRKKAYTSVQWIILPQLLKTAHDNPQQFLLSATARDLAARDGVDRVYASYRSKNIGSLCCADAERGLFIIARGLRLCHPPNVFEPAAILEIPSAQAIVDDRSGQLLFPDEAPRLKEWQREFEKREAAKREDEARKHEICQEREAEMQRRAKEARPRRRERDLSEMNAHAAHGSEFHEHGRPAVRMLKCLTCGSSFSEWECEQFDGCVCKQCGAKERNERLRIKPVPEERPGPETQREALGKKELTCLHCKLKTRAWVMFAYHADHPDGVCLCNDCRTMGLTFPYEYGSQ